VSAPAVIGLDVGGTKVAGGVLSASNELLARRQRPTIVDGRRDPGLAVTRQLAEELIADAAAAGASVEGVGAGFPEYVDPAGRLTSHEVLAWTIQPGELLADLGPVTIDSDVRCAALGEGVLGAATGFDSYAFVIVGTGLSYALVEDGRARPGARGEAIALGELEVSRDVDTETTLTLERYASGEGIRERYVAATGQPVSGAADVIAAADRGDPTAVAVVDSAARAVGAGLATLVRILDPGSIVVGGGVSTSGDRWRSAVAATYSEQASARTDAPPLRWATLGSDAGIIGAAIAHRDRLRGAVRSINA
jgi:glucokinase